jgi:hypothetical protein
MVKKLNLMLVLLPVLFLISCSSDSGNQKVISSQKVGDKVISVLNETDTLKKGQGSFLIEFRNASDNNLSDLGKIDANAFMQMDGGPMKGDFSVIKTEIPGRYVAKYNFTMPGTWNFDLTFELVGRAQFTLPVK